MQFYNSYRSYLKRRFGGPVLKVALNGGFSCPNRDGSKSSGGCTFCDNRSFSTAVLSSESVVNQFTSAIHRSSKRFRHYLPYLQPYSNTYGSVRQLEQMYEPLINVPGSVGLAIGTRPDCFNEEIYQYLGELSKRSYLSVELGLQSGHDSVLQKVNRGHSVDQFVYAAERLSSYGIEVVAHLILGLPGESGEMMEQTARKIGSMDSVAGVKIHQLMIIAGTEMEKSFQRGEIDLLSLEEYTEQLCRFLCSINPHQHVHRIMADSKVELGLIAPLWSTEKTGSISYIHEYMRKTGFVQGFRS
ncbi:putative Fe-S oxidoreductase [Chitinispirillum alkaliphilum]|nr:putative Fe-S oxidoreductase [Chitinispirillum alkaliphilum]